MLQARAIAAGLALAATWPAVAAPPNDSCSSATPVELGATPFDSTGATTDGLPHTACAFSNSSQIKNDVWFEFTPQRSGTYSFKTCGSAFDTRLAVYGTCNCEPTSGDLLGCAGDVCGRQSILTVQLAAGQCHKIRVGSGDSSSGSGVLAILEGGPFTSCPNPDHDCLTIGTPGCGDQACCDAVCLLDDFCCDTAWDIACVNAAAALCAGGPGPLDNDSCAAPRRIFEGLSVFTTIGATTDGAPVPSSFCFPPDHQIEQDVWFSYTATDTQLMRVLTCGSDFDTRVAVYNGSGCGVLPMQSCQDSGCNLQASGSFGVTVGHEYTIRVGGPPGVVGTGVIRLISGWTDVGSMLGCGPEASDHDCYSVGGPGCSDSPCCQYVSALDPYCFETSWDEICADEAAQWCYPPAGSIACPKAATLENEPCDASTNGGCASLDGAYGELSCGQTVCGTLWEVAGPADAQHRARDLDWYRFTLGHDRTHVTLTVRSDFIIAATILADGCRDMGVLAADEKVRGVDLDVMLDAGTYVAVIAPVAENLACEGAAGRYLVTLQCQSPCPADLAGSGGLPDGQVNIDDLLAVINSWGPCGPPACPTDIAPPGGSGVIDIDDLLTVINAWGPCE